MSRLIVISNRVNPPSDPGVGTAGGLAMALSAALRDNNGVWFGWSGQTAEQFTGQLAMQKIGGVTVALVDLEEQDVHEYYNGYANKTLWPLFHYRTDLAAYERSYGAGYARVNQRFADTVLPLIGPDDVIWVQDYHLIPLAEELRRRGVKNRIGFFLHVPWPARRVFTTLPHHEELVQAMLAYDLIGFQTQDHLEAFNEYIEHLDDGCVGEDGLVSGWGKTSRAATFPIGIDAEDFAKSVNSETAAASYRRMRDSMTGRKLILGIDRLDYSKGLEERFLAYEQFLTDNPAQQEEVFLLQVATPSRDEVEAYQDIRARLDTLSGRINGAFATIDWVPIRYVNRPYRRDELAGLYRAAHIGLVTPLRDGMNLVAKEYVAAQDPADPGVLVLSEFAGAAEQMREALIVNPFDREEVAEAIRQALAMPLKERQERWRALMDGVQTQNVSAWRDAFVCALKGGRPHNDMPAKKLAAVS
ncbi:MAG TPA: alpha,alpha-trehalose-phosphate synthase (UDP-forming) [Caulobacteraceae bacterium]|nr:alpha,alpha-trehalose-phosphate synthase (UDP-forming) [Caulobacteraceae bacterium]